MSMLLKVGPITIYAYTFLLGLGLLAGCLISSYLGTRKGYPIEQSVGAILWVITFALIGGRAAHIATNWSGYRTQPDLVLQMGRPMAFHGVLVGGILGLAIYASAQRLALGPLADAMSVGFPAVQVLGWTGALIQGIGHGRVTHSGWAWELPDAYGIIMPRFPTQIVGSLIAVIILATLLILWQRHEMQPGQLFGLFLLLNSAMYFALEFAREDTNLRIGQLGLSQVAYLIEFLAATCLLIYLRRRAGSTANTKLVPS